MVARASGCVHDRTEPVERRRLVVPRAGLGGWVDGLKERSRADSVRSRSFEWGGDVGCWRGKVRGWTEFTTVIHEDKFVFRGTSKAAEVIVCMSRSLEKIKTVITEIHSLESPNLERGTKVGLDNLPSLELGTPPRLGSWGTPGTFLYCS